MTADRLLLLLIEDNPGDARLVREALSGSPRFDVEYAGRLDAGISRLADGGVDVVVLDLGLPDSQGIDGLTKVLADAPAVPVVVCTGSEDETAGRSAVAAGAQDFIVKGKFEPDSLTRTLRYAVERHRLLAELKEANELLRALLDRERETASRLRELDALKSEFVSIVAHDLRSPMTVIAGYAEMLQLDGEGMAAAEREALLGRIVANITRLSDLVGDVFDVARIDSGDFTYTLAPFDLAAAVRRTVEEAAIAQPGRECRMVVPDNLSLAFGDEDRYWRVLANLLSNAFKFSPQAALVEVSVCERGHELEVRVRDHGPGIDPDDLPRLFGKFSRVAQRGPGPKAPGTGLGLYISKHLVEGQGGRMWVETVPDQGSSFFFTVPTARDRT